MRTISFYTHFEGLDASFSQDEIGNRKYKLQWVDKDGNFYIPKTFNLEDDEEAKKFLHGLIDGFF